MSNIKNPKDQDSNPLRQPKDDILAAFKAYCEHRGRTYHDPRREAANEAAHIRGFEDRQALRWK